MIEGCCPSEVTIRWSGSPATLAPDRIGDTVVTLGPSGTDAEAAARQHFPRVELTDSFGQAMETAWTKDICALVPTGYLERNSVGIRKSWVDLHFGYLDRLRLLALWEQPTKAMCVALNPDRVSDVTQARTVAIHPATLAFAREHVPQAEITYVRAKPLAAELAAASGADACIASLDVVSRTRALRPVKVFRPTMVWCLYGRTALAE